MIDHNGGIEEDSAHTLRLNFISARCTPMVQQRKYIKWPATALESINDEYTIKEEY
jgi:hypothetical protein